MGHDVLVVAAHPDDEVLGAGGTIARLVNEGHRVRAAILGEGATSRYARRDDAPAGEVDRLRDHARAAAKVLGAEEPWFGGLPDNRFDTVPRLEVVQLVEGWLQRSAPWAVYTHHRGDLNVDHVITHAAVLTATRPLPGAPVRDLYAFEAPSSTEWSFGTPDPFAPDVFVDIATSLETKVRALQCYEGEVRAFPHPRSPEALRAGAARWGSVSGLPAAEAFELMRSIR